MDEVRVRFSAWHLIVVVAIILTLLTGFNAVARELDQRNKIECIKLRESGADSLGRIDREACPYDMGGQPGG